ncbi:hypothetical protein SAMN04488168_11858 [Bacillus sp. 491mf]|nr:hypothetical protein SAMN04488168_11858 [Bacillus sp. 491mf]
MQQGVLKVLLLEHLFFINLSITKSVNNNENEKI